MRPRALATVVLALALGGLLGGPAARAASNASAAAGFIEDAQNKDGGFGAKHGKASDPTATLWASVALLAAGKNPRDEFLKNGRSADDYLVAHRSSYTSLEELGLLAIVQNAGKFGASLYGTPAQKIAGRLSQDAVAKDPRGAAVAILGLLAADTAASRETASSTAQSLLSSLTSDGAWGPSGNADSASTAIVLQALAAAGAINAESPAAKSAVNYLHAAQINDGSITESTRVDKATAAGSVTATAFTIQALAALGLPTLKTPSGKTVRQGLTQYQQRSTGGLTSKGGLYSPVPPAVIETAQAFPAFNGVTFPLAPVASTTGGPSLAKRTHAKGSDSTSKRVSSGTAAQGVGSTTGGSAKDRGAFKRATVNGNGKKRSGKDDASSKREATKSKADASASGGGTDVSGTVVGTGARLAAKAGASDDGLTNEQRATVGLTVALGLLFAVGAFLERRRPRPADAAPLVVVAATSAAAAVRLVGRPVVHHAARLSGVTVARSGLGPSPRRRWPLLVVLVVGAGLIAFPFAVHMFDRAPKGATMVSAFEPYMTGERIAGFQRDVRQVDEYAREVREKAPALLVPDAKNPAQAAQTFTQTFPQVALFSQQWPAVHETFDDLLGTIERNRVNYDAVAALPSFKLFPWFFVVPGAILVSLGAAGLALGRRPWIVLRRATIALGVGLVLAPVAFQMFDRAPKGGRMVTAFETIETRPTVQRVQGHFGTIAVGQGAIRTELVPALYARGLNDVQIARRLPAVVRVRDRWVKILNNITPMIGVMSDNVGNYRAVAALPSFRLFPWLFVGPGLLVIALIVLAGTRPLAVASEVRAPEPVTT